MVPTQTLKSSTSALLPSSARAPLGLGFLVWLGMLTLTVGFSIVAQPEIPLFYTLARPDQQIVDVKWLYILPATSLLFNFLNYGFIVLAKEIDQLLISLFAWSALCLQVIIGLAVARIVFITL